MLRICTPDVVITALSLVDGTAQDVKAAMGRDNDLRNIPIIAIDTVDCPAGRLDALAAGLNDVMRHPVNDIVLQARIRSLLRARSAKEDLQLHREAAGPMSLNLTSTKHLDTIRGATVALVTRKKHLSSIWKQELEAHAPFGVQDYDLADIRGLISAPIPDAVVIELNAKTSEMGLRLIADMRARSATRRSIIVALTDPGCPQLAAEALDRGAHDVLTSGFDGPELALRLRAQIAQKLQEDQLRTRFRSELLAASSDAMTGLHNRRYAMPFLDRVLHDARETGETFALLVADLDHFKRINDLYGHPVGDAVLIETAARLKSLVTPDQLLARIGGEEFLFILPGLSAVEAAQTAAAFCSAINQRPFLISDVDEPIHMTISIGAVVGNRKQTHKLTASELIARADQALYAAKNSGRNRVSLSKQNPVAA